MPKGSEVVDIVCCFFSEHERECERVRERERRDRRTLSAGRCLDLQVHVCMY